MGGLPKLAPGRDDATYAQKHLSLVLLDSHTRTWMLRGVLPVMNARLCTCSIPAMIVRIVVGSKQKPAHLGAWRRHTAITR